MRYCGQDDPVVAHAVELLGHTAGSMPMHAVVKAGTDDGGHFHVRATTFRTTVTWQRAGAPEVTYETVRNGTEDDHAVYVAEIWPQTMVAACAGLDVTGLITIPGMTATTIQSVEVSATADMTLLRLSPLGKGKRK